MATMNHKIHNLQFAGAFLAIVFLAAFHSRADDEITAIVGEAGGEGARGMQAVANVIYNRQQAHLPFTFYGEQNPVVQRQPARVFEQAREAWARRTQDITDGATHFENVEAFGTPAWARHMTVTAKIGQHTFYK
jgi:spore germination cell wall hydrolase CwlJ-like protein